MCRQELTPAYEPESRSLYRSRGGWKRNWLAALGITAVICRELPARAEEGLWPIEAGDSNDSGSSAELAECANQST